MYTIQEFTGIPGDFGLEVSSVNAGGDGCGGVFTTSGERGAVWHHASPASPVLMPIGSESFLYALNASGTAVGSTGMNNTATQEACIFANGSVQSLAALVGSGSLASGINAAGRVVGWGAHGAFVYDSQGGEAWFLDPLPGFESALALVVNAGGDVAGSSRSGDVRHACLWIGGTGAPVDLGPASFVSGINAQRQVVGSIGKPWPNAYAPVIWDVSGGTPVTVEIPLPAGAIGAHAEGINAAGTVVGSAWSSQSYNQKQDAFVYENGASTSLNTQIAAGSGWHLEFARAINDDGQIVCNGTLNGEDAVALLTPESAAQTLDIDKILVAILFGGVSVDGGGLVIVGGHGRKVPPWGPPDPVLRQRRDVLIALAAEALASEMEGGGAREHLRGAAIDAARRALGELEQAGAVRGAPPAAAPRQRRQTVVRPIRFGRRAAPMNGEESAEREVEIPRLEVFDPIVAPGT